MKYPLLILSFLFNSVFAFGQTKATYTNYVSANFGKIAIMQNIQNVVINRDTVEIFRTSDAGLNRLYNPKNGLFRALIIKTESGLDECRKSIEQHKSTILDYYLTNVDEYLRQFPEYKNGFDYRIYNKEVAFYKYQNIGVATAEKHLIQINKDGLAKIKAKADSIKKFNYNQSKSILNNSARTTKVTEIASDKVWQPLGMDSLHFIEMYGSEKEYNIQRSMKRQSSHGDLVLLIGVKKWWMSDLSDFLQHSGYYEDDASEIDRPGIFQFAFKERIALGHKPQKIVATAFIDKTDRIKKVNITGSADAMIFLFLNYWNRSDISINKLKSKGYVYQDFVSDTIKWTWPGLNPIITIVKNPAITVF